MLMGDLINAFYVHVYFNREVSPCVFALMRAYPFDERRISRACLQS